MFAKFRKFLEWDGYGMMARLRAVGRLLCRSWMPRREGEFAALRRGRWRKCAEAEVRCGPPHAGLSMLLPRKGANLRLGFIVISGCRQSRPQSQMDNPRSLRDDQLAGATAKPSVKMDAALILII